MARKTSQLIPDQRRTLILQELRRNGVMSFRQLASIVGASEMTVRRDAQALHADGKLSITTGGVSLPHSVLREPSRAEKAVVETSEKDAIAHEAARLVLPSQTIYLDAGTTVQSLRPYMQDLAGLTIVSNDFATLHAFVGLQETDLIFVGGRVDQENMSTTGRLAAMTINELTFDIAFISCSSWDVRRGVTTPSEEKIEPKRAARSAATRAILLTTSSKFGTFSKYRVAGLQEFDGIITDAALDNRSAEAVRSIGVDLTLAVPSASNSA